MKHRICNTGAAQVLLPIYKIQPKTLNLSVTQAWIKGARASPRTLDMMVQSLAALNIAEKKMMKDRAKQARAKFD